MSDRINNPKDYILNELSRRGKSTDILSKKNIRRYY